MSSEKISKVGVKREADFLYFIDKDGNVAKTKMAAKRKPTDKTEIVAKTGIKKEKGYLYFLDKDGDVSRAKMARKGK